MSETASVRPVMTPLPGWRDPVDVLARFASDRMPVLLHSAGPPEAGEDIGRWSFLCSDPFETVSWSAGDAGDPFEMLERAVSRYRVHAPPECPFAGGAVGYIGYDAAAAVEPVRKRRRETSGGPRAPGMLFGLYDWAIAWDHASRRWWHLSTGLAGSEGARGDAAGRAARASSGPPGGRDRAGGSVRWSGSGISKDGYMNMVEAAKDLIRDGEIYQVNLSQRLELEVGADPVELYRGVVHRSPAPFSAYLDAGTFQVLSASPERFVSLRGGIAETRPIKGTRPRGATPPEDDRLRRELAGSEKDRAENVMIVDLARNDLGRVCVPGSIRPEAICRLESYASVHHLTSIVRGSLRPGTGRATLLRAVFPPGSMTGAPKVRAMQVIEDLEPTDRGIYSGALGYLSFCGAMDLSVVIRTVIVSQGRGWLQVGGGIVADSDPASEHTESLDKARSVLRGLGVRERSRPANPGT